MAQLLTSLGDTAFVCNGHVRYGDLPQGVLDVVPAVGVTAVHFEPSRIAADVVAKWLAGGGGGSAGEAAGRFVEIPVVYDGPDLAEIGGGLAADEVVRRHAEAEYTVGAVGFQPGFGYLEGLPPELHTPRKASPRTRVAAGSVGIGGPYTGVYPSDSPGGWNLIGRTPLVMWDELRDEPSLLRAGDRVGFRPIDAAEFERLANENRPTPPPADNPVEQPLLRVVSGGVQTTVQGLGQPGRQHLGVSPGGAMDAASLRLANLLVGNDPGAPAIEATLLGPVLEALEPLTVGLAGAADAARPRRLASGERLDLRRLVGGARAYVALPGGVAGRVGRALGEGDPVGSLDAAAIDHEALDLGRGRSLRTAAWIRGGKPVTLRVLRGPQADRFDAAGWRSLLSAPYRVSPDSSRMGVRLEGPPLRPKNVEGLPSQPVCRGVVQIPPDGQPIVLGADRQTLGGYPIAAVVASVDWPRLGQLSPGDTVRLEEIDLATAQALRRQAERDLAIASVAIRLDR